MFRFSNPEYLYLLILIPAFVLGYLWLGIRRKKALTEFGDPKLLSELMPDVSPYRPLVKFYTILFALFLLILVLAQPQFGSKVETMKRKGIELMICMDVSNSMNAQDIEPSRLERAKQAVAHMVDQLENDKLGIIVFAGQAYTQLPITTDYPSAKMFLNTISTDMVPTQGTAIGAAIDRAISSFSAQENVNRAIIVITDGENHEDNAVEAAKRAAEKGIKVYTVGMGLPDGAPIPLTPGNNTDFLKDKDGNVVISKLDEKSLQEIAMTASGNYIPANNIRNGMDALIKELSQLEKSELEAKVYTDFDDQFPFVSGIVLFLLIAEATILERRNRYLSQYKLFDTKRENRLK